MPIGVIINALSVAAGGVIGHYSGINCLKNLIRSLPRFLESAQWEWELVPSGL